MDFCSEISTSLNCDTSLSVHPLFLAADGNFETADGNYIILQSDIKID